MFFNVKEIFMPLFKQRGFCFVFDQDSAVVIDFSNLDVLYESLDWGAQICIWSGADNNSRGWEKIGSFFGKI